MGSPVYQLREARGEGILIYFDPFGEIQNKGTQSLKLPWGNSHPAILAVTAMGYWGVSQRFDFVEIIGVDFTLDHLAERC